MRTTRYVLGIDPAWTAHQASGVALVQMSSKGRPRLLAVARSYEEFTRARKDAALAWQTKVRGTLPNIAQLLQTCTGLIKKPPDLIALDIPLSDRPLAGRRVCDNALTSAYVARGAGTHTPNANRPGPISKALFEQLLCSGYQWLQSDVSAVVQAAPLYFAETYPHPAIIELMELPRRLAYKTSRVQQYWPEASPTERRQLVCKNLEKLRRALAGEIAGVEDMLPPAQEILKLGKRALLKHFEDALDAIVCAWVGIQILQDRAVAYGNSAGTIWVPRPGQATYAV